MGPRRHTGRWRRALRLSKVPATDGTATLAATSPPIARVFERVILSEAKDPYPRPPLLRRVGALVHHLLEG